MNNGGVFFLEQTFKDTKGVIRNHDSNSGRISKIPKGYSETMIRTMAYYTIAKTYDKTASIDLQNITQKTEN
jgi:hypothetical protein